MSVGDIAVRVWGAIAAAAWLFAVANWVLALGHRAEGVSLSTLLLQGQKSFDSENFTGPGKGYQRRFMLGLGVFFLCVVLGTVVSLALGQG